MPLFFSRHCSFAGIRVSSLRPTFRMTEALRRGGQDKREGREGKKMGRGGAGGGEGRTIGKHRERGKISARDTCAAPRR